jgi:hypothetical protein
MSKAPADCNSNVVLEGMRTLALALLLAVQDPTYTATVQLEGI